MPRRSTKSSVPSSPCNLVLQPKPELLSKIARLAELDGTTPENFTVAALEEWMDSTGDLLLEFKQNHPETPVLNNLIEFVPKAIKSEQDHARIVNIQKNFRPKHCFAATKTLH